jgi:type IV secretory pathway VirB6-like protein
MNLAKKITQVLSLIFLIALASSCKRQCFTTDEFDVSNASVDSYPTNDGINGTDYDAVNGGQVANWHNTDLRSNGDMFLIRISGAWTPWNGGKYGSMTQSQLNALPVCNFCAKKDPSNPNCICYAKQNVTAERFQVCDPEDIDQQNNPNLCSCTKDPQYGSAIDYGTYHFPLNYFEKSETTKIADKQVACKYIAGMGAYIGLFGRNGVSNPSRLYHLFVDNRVDEDGIATKVCDINLNSNGECVDSSGTDRTAYIFKSANKKIFMRDDGDGNGFENPNTSNDTDHTSGEVVKLKIFDLYYNDNYGHYNIDILKGVGDSSDLSSVGLLEYLVRLVEDNLLGELESFETLSQDEDGNTVKTITQKRAGGIIKFMYNSIVQDSGFVLFLNVTMSIYITFFGIAVLLGVAELSKKELMSRVVKISLVMFFTNAASWNFYNEIIVGFFYDSTNYLVSMLMSLSDASLSKAMDTSAIVVAQMDRAIDISNSTRFSYIDNSIKMMLSPGFAGKVFSLLFSDLFGLVYILLIYALVAFFISTMLIAASMYLVNIIKIIFVLCLGPIFISFTLFNQTSSMFKNWLAFLGARALEIIIIFAILYNFVMLIDAGFRDLLAFEACVEPFSFGGMFSINLLKASGISDRNVVTWLTSIAKIGALIYITLLVLNKAATIAGHLITIGGVANKNASGAGHGQSGMNLASDTMGELNSTAYSVASTLLNAGATGAMYAGKGASYATRALGIDKTLSKIGDYVMPVKFLRETARNKMLIDPIIERAQKDALSQKNPDGTPLSKAQTDQFVRAQTFAKLNQQSGTRPDSGGSKEDVHKPLQSTLLGLSQEKIAARLDQKLIHEPAQKFLKEKGKELRERGLYGKDLEKSLKESLVSWAKDNLSSNDPANPFSSVSMLAQSLDKKSNDSSLSSFEKKLLRQIKSEGRLPNAKAAQIFANNPEQQKKYERHLLERAAEMDAKNKEIQENRFNSFGGLKAWTSHAASRGLDGISRFTGFELETRNPNVAQKSFVRNLTNRQMGERGLAQEANSKFNPFRMSNIADRLNPFGGSLEAAARQSKRQNLLDYLAQNHQKQKDLPVLPARPTAKEQKSYREALRERDSEQSRRVFFQGQIQELATKDLVKKVGEIATMERKGKKEEAARAKAEMLLDARTALRMNSGDRESFKKDGLSLFEKAARLDYVQRQLGIDGESALSRFSKGISDGVKKDVADLKAKVASGSRAQDLQGEVDGLMRLNSGAFSKNLSDQDFDKLSSVLKDQITEVTADRKPADNSLERGQTPEDKRALAEENAALNQRKKDAQESIESLVDELQKAETRFEREATKRAKEQEAESKYQKERQAAVDETFSLIGKIANLKVNSGEAAEIARLEQNLRDKFAAEVESRTAHQINKLEKEAAEALALQSLEAVKKVAEKNSELLAAPINKNAADSFMQGLEAANLGITGSAADLALKGDIFGSLLNGSAASALLGGANVPDSGPLNETQKKELGMHQNQLNSQLKVSNMNIRLKEFELSQLKATNADAAQIAQLERQISDLTREASRLERESDKVEASLKT